MCMLRHTYPCKLVKGSLSGSKIKDLYVTHLILLHKFGTMNRFLDSADMMELADMLDLGSSASRHAGSTPVIRTKTQIQPNRFVVRHGSVLHFTIVNFLLRLAQVNIRILNRAIFFG